MKTIGVIGGLSWHSTAFYYQHINQFTAKKLGGLHCANINMISLDFEPIAELMKQKSWHKLSQVLLEPSKRLQDMGTEGIVLANNTLHQLMLELERTLTIPFLHIADALGNKLSTLGVKKIGLLGTASTMQSGFYKKRLLDKYQIEVIIPDSKKCLWLDNIIFSELCFGTINKRAQQGVGQLIEDLACQGAQAIALACTELPLLFNQDSLQHTIPNTETSIPLFDTSLLHCQYAVNWSLDLGKGK